MRYAFAALLIISTTAFAADKDELKKLQGKWDVVRLVGGGKEAPKDQAPPQLSIKEDVLSGFGPDIKIATDGTKSPKWLSMTFSRQGKENTVNAIYEIDGETLKICMPLAPAKGQGAVFENKRPEGFDTKDIPAMMIEMKKAK